MYLIEILLNCSDDVRENKGLMVSFHVSQFHSLCDIKMDLKRNNELAVSEKSDGLAEKILRFVFMLLV